MDGNIATASIQVSRNSQADALKGAAILLVVAGHIVEGLLSSQLNMNIYMAIYSFHMPLFAFLAGLFAKPFISERDGANIVKRIVLPLIVFQIAYTLYVKIVPGWTYGPLQPYWLLWFLLALFYWRLLLPVTWSPIGLIVTFTLALIAGYFPQVGGNFGLSRAVYFFPFFIIGSLYGFQILQAVTKRRRLSWLWFFVAMASIAVWAHFGLSPVNLRGSEPYESSRAFTHEPVAGRALLMLIAFMGMIGFCALVPSRSKSLEYLGRNVFAIFLFHGFVIMAFKNYLAPQIPVGYVGLPVIGLGAALVCFALAPLQKNMEKVFDNLYALLTKLNTALTPKPRRLD